MDAVSSRLWPESDRLCWFPAGWDLDAQAAGVNVFFLYFYYANNRNGGIPFEKKTMPMRPGGFVAAIYRCCPALLANLST